VRVASILGRAIKSDSGRVADAYVHPKNPRDAIDLDAVPKVRKNVSRANRERTSRIAVRGTHPVAVRCRKASHDVGLYISSRCHFHGPSRGRIDEAKANDQPQSKPFHGVPLRCERPPGFAPSSDFPLGSKGPRPTPPVRLRSAALAYPVWPDMQVRNPKTQCPASVRHGSQTAGWGCWPRRQASAASRRCRVTGCAAGS
jgi:hypothetical protein